MHRTAAQNLGKPQRFTVATNLHLPGASTGLVESYYSLTTTNDHGFLVSPDGLTGLVLIDEQIWWLGPQTCPWLPERSGLEVYGLRIGMEWGQLIAGVPLDKMRDARVPIEELWGRAETTSATSLFPQLPLERLRTLLLARATGGFVDQWVTKVAGLIRAGEHCVAEIADLSDVSNRQLHRRCLTYFGLPPSVLMRIFRLRRAATDVAQRKNLELAELAVASGYFDQSHLNRDTRELSGQSPTTAFKRASNVRFVQYQPNAAQ
ncbi:hypothetical protein CQ018_10765 [Arthrobacter sp. MYb227]|uniref:AraC family transcriptional regulator n=1 Tax=Arthrobacter sp. MYb227 TaxID=1848601 RepID=UPI000CFB583B|nr:helix-turn-helix domain-containing protein [Arthrobacter sp. MYb227]PQZ92942.1 hypothetical protein CQ018_10765 [Arthrobacter sp. MYb227]